MFALACTAATLGALGAAPGLAAGNHRHAASCDALLPEPTLAEAMEPATGVLPTLTTKPVFTEKYSAWGDSASGDRGRSIYNTQCYYLWQYPTEESIPAGDPDPDTIDNQFTAPPAIVAVGSNVSLREWGYIKAAQGGAAGFTGADTDPVANYNAQQNVILSEGSKAFAISFTLPSPAGKPPEIDYGLFVLSKGHNMIEVWDWPATLQAEEAIVGVLLSKKAF